MWAVIDWQIHYTHWCTMNFRTCPKVLGHLKIMHVCDCDWLFHQKASARKWSPTPMEPVLVTQHQGPPRKMQCIVEQHPNATATLVYSVQIGLADRTHVLTQSRIIQQIDNSSPWNVNYCELMFKYFLHAVLWATWTLPGDPAAGCYSNWEAPICTGPTGESGKHQPNKGNPSWSLWWSISVGRQTPPATF